MSMPAAEWPEAEQRIAEVARTRRGRHRDKALASYRRTRALELRAQGKAYAEIAREVGYANKGTAHKVISQALRHGRPRTSTSCARSRWTGSTPCTRRCGRPPWPVTSRR